MIERPGINTVSISASLRRGGWLSSQRIANDTDAVDEGLNLQIRGRCHTSYSDPSASVVLDLHALKNPDFTFQRHGSETRSQTGTVNEFLKKDLQSISFAAVASPTNSHERTSWNFAYIIDHILRHHTNVMYDATGANGSPQGWVTEQDFDFAGSTPVEVFIVRKTSNLWSTLQKIGGGEEGGGEFYRLYVTKKNKIVYQPSPFYLSNPVVQTLTKANIRGTVQVRQRQKTVGQVELSAVKNANTVFTSKFPSQPTEGRIQRLTRGVWAEDQARCDLHAQRLYKWLSRPYTLQLNVDPGMVLFDGGLELADRVHITYDGPVEDADTGHGVHLAIDNDFFIYDINLQIGDNFDGIARLGLEFDNAN